MTDTPDLRLRRAYRLMKDSGGPRLMVAERAKDLILVTLDSDGDPRGEYSLTPEEADALADKISELASMVRSRNV